MKSIPLALVGLLGLSSACAADNVELAETSVQKRSMAVSTPQETPSESLLTATPIDGASAQPGKSAASPYRSRVASSATQPSSLNKKTPDKKTPDERTPGEVTGKSDEKATSQIKPPSATEKETVFKEMVVTGEVE